MNSHVFQFSWATIEQILQTTLHTKDTLGGGTYAIDLTLLMLLVGDDDDDDGDDDDDDDDANDDDEMTANYCYQTPAEQFRHLLYKPPKVLGPTVDAERSAVRARSPHGPRKRPRALNRQTCALSESIIKSMRVNLYTFGFVN